MNTHSNTTNFYIKYSAQYARLAEEVAFILEGRLRSEHIPFASVTWRTKSLESLLSKVERKGYSDPEKQVTDLAGVRVVYLYSSDFPHIANIINAEFIIITQSERPIPERFDQFGYSAHHYNVFLTKRYYGPRYDSLHDLPCEVQVRTVLQDAWAIVSHHLEYKNEDSVPIPLRRQLHALAGAFEVADSHLDQLRQQRLEYVTSLADFSSIFSQTTDLNYDAFLAFIAACHPNLQLETTRGAAQNVHAILRNEGITTVGKLNQIYQRTETARREFFEREHWGKSQARHAFVALGLANSNALRWFVHHNDIELINELREKYKTITNA